MNHRLIRNLVKPGPFKYTSPPMLCLLFGLAMFLVFPSIGVVQKYLGTSGVAFYVFLTSSFILVAYLPVLRRLFSRITVAQAIWLIVITFLVLIVVFAVLYPIANSGIVGGGSDRDDALNIAVRELLHGRYPYGSETYLGNPVTPLPGALILAIPFVVLGNSAYQNFIWLSVFMITVGNIFNDARLALILLWTILAVSPVVLQEFVTGGDLLSNSIYVFIFTLFMAKFVSNPYTGVWQKVLSAALLGVGLSSRPNFILILPLLFALLVQNAGWKPAIKYVAITCVSLVAISLPIYFYAPQDFSPLHVRRILDFKLLPYSAIILPIVASVITLALSYQRMDKNCIVLFRNFAFVQAFLVLSGVILNTLEAGVPDFRFAGFGLVFLFFGVFAYWANVIEKLHLTSGKGNIYGVG